MAFNKSQYYSSIFNQEANLASNNPLLGDIETSNSNIPIKEQEEAKQAVIAQGGLQIPSPPTS